MDTPLKRKIMRTVPLKERLPISMTVNGESPKSPDPVFRSIPFLHYADTRGAFVALRDMDMSTTAVVLFDEVPYRPDEGCVMVVYNGYNEPEGEETFEALKDALGTSDGVVCHARYKNSSLESVAAEITQYATQPIKSETTMSRALTPLEVQDVFLTEVANIAEEYANDEDLTSSEKCHGVAFSVLAAIDGSRGISPMQLVAIPAENTKQICIDQGEDFVQPGTILNPEFNLHTRYDLIRKDVMSGMPDDTEEIVSEAADELESLLDDIPF